MPVATLCFDDVLRILTILLHQSLRNAWQRLAREAIVTSAYRSGQRDGTTRETSTYVEPIPRVSSVANAFRLFFEAV
jgi:hypothetical protein